MTVGDFVETGTFASLASLNGDDPKVVGAFDARDAVPRTELDFSFCLELRDDKGRRDGRIDFLVNYSGFAPRRTRYDESVIDFSNEPDSGRTTSFVIDLHAGALAHFRISMNEQASNQEKQLRSSASFVPAVDLADRALVIEDAHNGPASAQRCVATFCLQLAGLVDATASTPLGDQALSIALHGAMYECIAAANESGTVDQMRMVNLDDWR